MLCAGRAAPRYLDEVAPGVSGAPLRAAGVPAVLGSHPPRGHLSDLQGPGRLPERAGHNDSAQGHRDRPQRRDRRDAHHHRDGPAAHRSYRKVASPFFTPKAMGHIDPIVDASARHVVEPAGRRKRRVRLRRRRRRGASAAGAVDDPRRPPRAGTAHPRTHQPALRPRRRGAAASSAPKTASQAHP